MVITSRNGSEGGNRIGGVRHRIGCANRELRNSDRMNQVAKINHTGNSAGPDGFARGCAVRCAVRCAVGCAVGCGTSRSSGPIASGWITAGSFEIRHKYIVIIGIAVNDLARQVCEHRQHRVYKTPPKIFHQLPPGGIIDHRGVFFDRLVGVDNVPFMFPICGWMREVCERVVYFAHHLAQAIQHMFCLRTHLSEGRTLHIGNQSCQVSAGWKFDLRQDVFRNGGHHGGYR